MVTKDEVVGMSTGKAVITIERAPVTAFATAVTETSPIYLRADAAKSAGFADIPVPPTYFFSAAAHFGAHPEDQPADAVPSTNPLIVVIGGLLSKGGMVLHGEEEYTYHAPICVGDVITGEGKVVDLYSKPVTSRGAGAPDPAGEKTMTFLVTEDEYRNQRGELVLTARMNLIHRS